MSEEVSVPDNVKEFVESLIGKYNLNSPKITYSLGSNLSEGLMSKTYAVDLSDDKQSLHLFLKCPLDMVVSGPIPLDRTYGNEIHFYEVILPKYQEFLKEKCIENGLRNMPKCYGINENKALALENLRANGYELCDKTFIGNEEHTELIFRTYAKFHAVGFAYKDRKPEEHRELLEGVTDMLRAATKEFSAQTMHAGIASIQNFFKALDPDKDKFILDQSQKILAELGDLGIEKTLEDDRYKFCPDTRRLLVQ